MGFCKLSLPLDISVYADKDTLIHTGKVTREFIPTAASPRFIAGYNSNPFVSYKGTGLYFLEKKSGGEWVLRILPHFEWIDANRSRLNSEKTSRMRLKLPGLRGGTRVFRREDGRLVEQESSFENDILVFNPKSGQYLIR